MVNYDYTIFAISNSGATIALMENIENKEDAKAYLSQIIKQAVTRKTRLVSLGDIIFDPSYVMAYRISKERIWEESDSHCCLCDDETEEDEPVMDVINLEVPPAEGGEEPMEESVPEEVL